MTRIKADRLEELMNDYRLMRPIFYEPPKDSKDELSDDADAILSGTFSTTPFRYERYHYPAKYDKEKDICLYPSGELWGKISNRFLANAIDAKSENTVRTILKTNEVAEDKLNKICSVLHVSSDYLQGINDVNVTTFESYISDKYINLRLYPDEHVCLDFQTYIDGCSEAKKQNRIDKDGIIITSDKGSADSLSFLALLPGKPDPSWRKHRDLFTWVRPEDILASFTDFLDAYLHSYDFTFIHPFKSVPSQLLEHSDSILHEMTERLEGPLPLVDAINLIDSDIQSGNFVKMSEYIKHHPESLEHAKKMVRDHTWDRIFEEAMKGGSDNGKL
ncbi:MAG: hypothetical protein PUA95_03330 [Lactimicrobium massiliense]|nr:hypothetical protein [Lactimicrobium massiliense]